MVGTPLADPILQPLLASARAGEGGTVEVVGVDRRYRLLAVDVPEFGFINVYGTDVTAVHDLEEAYRENERLLLNILPEPIADRLRRGERPIADRFEDVSLLFADIVGFTSLSGGMGAHELVSVLNEVFSVFDELVDGAGLEKVKTIGDTVNIASRMESTGVPGRIQVTAAVEVRLRGGFQFDPRGLTEIRGKGPMSTFFLVGEADGSLGAGPDMVGP